MTTKTSRINWIDWAKFFGIYLVILGHVNSECSLGRFVYSFHMPMFFALSGLTFKLRPLKEEIKINAKRILIPYLFFMALGYVYWLLGAFTIHPERLQPDIVTGTIIKPILGTLFGTICQTQFSTFVNIPLWFLPALFCIRIIASVFENWCKQKGLSSKQRNYLYICASIIFFSLGIMIKRNPILLPFSLDSVFQNIPFFFAAYILKKSILSLKPTISPTRIGLSIILFTGLFFLSETKEMLESNTSGYFLIETLTILNAAIGTIAFLAICSTISIQQKGVFALIGRNTITIMGTHAPFIPVVTLILAFIINKETAFGNIDSINGSDAINNPNYTFIFIRSLITLALCIVPCYIFERWFPRFIGRNAPNK